MIRKVGLIINCRRQQAIELAEELTRWLTARNIEVCLVEPECIGRLSIPMEYAEIRKGEQDLIIALGGDGTFLRAARFTAPKGVPVLGVNLGHLGFLSEVEKGAVYEGLEKVLAGQYIIDERMMLQTELIRNNEVINRFYGLNDMVIHKGALSRLLQMKIFVGEEFMGFYKADGIILSSPTGSTAYSLSAGGPIVHPELEVMVLTPICPHSLNARPTIIPAGGICSIEVLNATSEVLLTVDGQTGFSLQDNDIISVTRAPFKAAFIRIHPQRFFTVLRNKLCASEQGVDDFN